MHRPLPVVQRDRVYWRAGWVEPERTAWDAEVARLVSGDRWILDGNFGGTLERRINACDTVVCRFPAPAVPWRVLRRRLQHRARADMAPGCHERLWLDFVRWIWTYAERRRPLLLRRPRALRPGQQAVVLRSDAQAERFLESVRA